MDTNSIDTQQDNNLISCFNCDQCSNCYVCENLSKAQDCILNFQFISPQRFQQALQLYDQCIPYNLPYNPFNPEPCFIEFRNKFMNQIYQEAQIAGDIILVEEYFSHLYIEDNEIKQVVIEDWMIHDYNNGVPNKRCEQLEQSGGCSDCKNIFSSTFCVLSQNITYSTQLIQCQFCEECEQCRECTSLSECSRCQQCVNCVNVHDCEACSFVFDSSKLSYCEHCVKCTNCENCRDCINCQDLKNNQYCIDNVQYSEQEYKQRTEAMTV